MRGFRLGKTPEETRAEVFERACVQLQTWFPDFLLIVRESRSAMRVRRSDATWARGAVERFRGFEDEDDRLDQKVFRLEGGDPHAQ